MATETTPPNDSPKPGSLCPACNGESLQVSGSVAVQYDVRLGGPDRQVFVVGESISLDGWDLESDAHCPRCGWHGTVADVAPLKTG